jgi:hypothetical protein
MTEFNQTTQHTSIADVSEGMARMDLNSGATRGERNPIPSTIRKAKNRGLVHSFAVPVVKREYFCPKCKLDNRDVKGLVAVGHFCGRHVSTYHQMVAGQVLFDACHSTKDGLQLILEGKITVVLARGVEEEGGSGSYDELAE